MQAHILVAEDDPTTRRLLADILTEADYDVMTASNGSEALDLIQRISFDIVLTDIRMPLVDGVELLQATRRQRQPPAVILLTGYGSLETVMAAMRCGAANYLLKPCQADQLLRSVDVALRQRTAEQARNSALETIAQTVRELQRLSAPEEVEAPPSTPEAQEGRRYLCVGELRIDRYRHGVSVDGSPIHLTPTEYALLLGLAESAGRVVTYTALVLQSHGYQAAEEEAQELLKIHVHRLRRKIAPYQIVNVRATGYLLSTTPAEPA